MSNFQNTRNSAINDDIIEQFTSYHSSITTVEQFIEEGLINVVSEAINPQRSQNPEEIETGQAFGGSQNSQTSFNTNNNSQGF